MVQPDLTALLSSVGAPPLAMTRCTLRKTYSGTDGRVQSQRMPQQFTSWEAIYASLLGSFPTERYHTNATLEIDAVTLTASQRRLRIKRYMPIFWSRLTGFDQKLARLSHRTRSAAMRVTLRGAGSWRKRNLPASLVAFFDDSFCFCETNGGGHALCYLIPGEGGSNAVGTRRLNWVWYVNIPEGDDLNAVMTDCSGEFKKRRCCSGAGQ